MADCERRFVTVGSRQVHYRRGGSGPAAVLLHASPLSSASLLPLARSLTRRFTVIALDTPGYGLSDPLPLAEPRIADYADALAETLTALGLDRCVVYGFHTGAAIGLDLAARHPGRVAAAVLEGVLVPTGEERADLLAHYAPWFPPVWDGTHLIANWSRVRDMFIFWPWYRREESARLAVAMPSAATINDAVLDLLRAGEAYPLGYRAAFAYDAAPAVAALTVPVTVVADPDDPLSAQLARLPALPPGVAAELLGPDRDSRIAALLAAGAGGLPPAPPAPAAVPLPGRVWRDITPTPAGQLLTRRVADAPGRPLVLLHASPGSSRALEPLLLELGRTRPVIAFDTIGNGESDKPPWAAPAAADYADTIAAALDARGLDRVDLYGTHTGAMLAIETAVRHPDRIHRLVLDGVVIFDDEERDDILAHYLEPFEPVWDGGHLLRSWSVRRDSKLWWPWYRRTPDRHRPAPPPTVESLQRDVVEVLKSGETYALAYRVALGYPTRDRLPLVTARTLVCAPAHDVLGAYSAEAARLAPDAATCVVPADPAGLAELVGRFLDTGAMLYTRASTKSGGGEQGGFPSA
jgi:pimeloyl-ACP methyl ester carboxylesterase